jgi:hypothetical protein
MDITFGILILLGVGTLLAGVLDGIHGMAGMQALDGEIIFTILGHGTKTHSFLLGATTLG